MTISSTTRKAGPFTGTGAVSSFPFAFKVFSASDLYVVVLNTSTNVETQLVLTTDFTASLNADQNTSPGGTITLTAGPLASGNTMTITTNVSALQQTDLTNQGGFYPSVITAAFDKLTILVQQVIEKLGRSLTLPLSMPANVSTSMPMPSANKVIGWNSTGTALENLNAADIATQVIGANAVIDTFSGDGSTTSFTLSADPLNINNLDVYISGVRQAKSKYSIAGTTLTFVIAPPAGTGNIETKQAQAQTYPVSALTDNVVTTTKVADGAITTPKIADAGVTPAKLSAAFGSWVTASTAAIARAALGLGTAATKDSGTSAGNVVVLDGSGKLPGVDGSALTNLPATGLQTSNFTGANQSLSANGYQKIPGGLIVQWGNASITYTGTTVSLPIAFPTACASVALVGGTAANAGYQLTAKTTTGFTLTSSYSASASTVYWIAIGY